MTRLRRVRRAALRVLLLLALVGPFVTFGCANRLILGENHEHIDPSGATQRIVRVNGRAVECWVVRSPGAAREPAREVDAFVLFFVGKADRADRWTTAVASAWGHRRVEVWGMNYPGSGGSEGSAALPEVAPDALGVYDAVRAAAGARPIFVHASSFGTTVGLHVAAHRPLAGLILQNPPPLRQLILGRYGWWNLWLLAGPVAARVPDDLDSLANGAASTAPAVFITCGDDSVIPASYHRKVIDAYAGPKRIIEMPGAGHHSPLTQEAAESLTVNMNWLWQNATAPAPAASSPSPSTRPASPASSPP